MNWMTQDWTTGQLNALVKNIGGDKIARGILDGTVKFTVLKESILNLIRTLWVSAQPAVTTSEDYFKEAGVVVMGDNFQNQFLGLEIGASERTEFTIRKLEKESLDRPILDELGDKAEISASQFKAFLAENRRSPEWFIFYLRGRDGNLWAVIAHWNSVIDGWYVRAFSVGNPNEWVAGHRVVSRN